MIDFVQNIKGQFKKSMDFHRFAAGLPDFGPEIGNIAGIAVEKRHNR